MAMQELAPDLGKPVDLPKTKANLETVCHGIASGRLG